MTNNNNGQWKVNQATFQGYMRAKMEDIIKIQTGLVEKVDTHDKDISTAKGMAKGAMFIGGLGFLGAGWEMIKSFIFK